MTGSPLASVILGLASAACWGAGDFSGGLATRRAHVFGVMIASQAFGVALLIALALALSQPIPPLGDLVGGGVAGLTGEMGLIALYLALASGRMGVAAPVSAVITAAIPVVTGAFWQGAPKALQFVGFGLALVGIWFVSWTEGSHVRWRELGLPALAGIAFGIFLVIIHQVSSVSVLWPLVMARITSVSLIVAMATLARQPYLPERPHLLLAALAGIMDAGGNTFYALASQTGRLDVAAVISSLYPASTVLLAWLILKERIARLQSVGIVTSLVAIVLITL